MYQVVQNARSGKLAVATVPDPLVRPGHLLVQNVASVISAGTEKMVVDLAAKSLLGKARERPEQVLAVLRRIRTQGLLPTIAQVTQKLNEPIGLGYSSAGVVLACGDGVQGYKPGDRVASNGPHAGLVCVPKHLCARVPDGVSCEQAAFTVIGSIALQGVRLARLGLGETVLVIGLGLLGQVAVRLLKAQGCKVLGTDLDTAKCRLAVQQGADHAAPHLSADDVRQLSGGIGADAVLITAATKSDGPVQLAGEAVRPKGRVVAVGAVGLNLPRQPYYLKEAEFMISCSYGPGRYDREYEERGHDYPVGYARWTEQRNMQAVLGLMAGGQLDVGPLVTHRFDIEQAEAAYELIKTGCEPYLGIVLNFGAAPPEARSHAVAGQVAKQAGQVTIGCLGAGGFARMVLLPAVRKVASLKPYLLCSAGGLSAESSRESLGFERVTANEDDVVGEPNVDAVLVLTRHNLHARQVVKALQAGKHVFVEKPLALTVEELAAIEQAWLACPPPRPLLTVGFNRRFAPLARALRGHFDGLKCPLTATIRFNAGYLAPEHWTQDEAVGGGRIIGEACHAVDLATYLVGSPPVRVFAESIGGPQAPKITDDQCFITLRHANGSISNVAYLSGGDKAMPKERVELLGGGRMGILDDFCELTLSGQGKPTHRKQLQDKGHLEEMRQFASVLTSGGEAPISWQELYAVSLATILAVRSLREGRPIDLAEFDALSAPQSAAA